ncbi:MAG: hypothetical protein IJR32_03335 [Paludibacteraceae bacterium]|nr:hypothetical protein [Paludibacteraceae bacterium]MCR4619611.1 hypothetical protein [Paludibacteraceae bacterium]
MDFSDLKYVTNNDCNGICANGCRGVSGKKLSVYDWLADLPETVSDTDFVEVQFKNTRKGYYLNSTHIPLVKGDIVAVESTPGHDIGEVTLVGRLVLTQIKRANVNLERFEIKRVYRKAKESDLEKWKESKALEQETMIRSRQIAEELGLQMKIGDVEYQGDGQKAIFYYIADQRVDFRQLIKVLADTFHVRIEMRQIGVRQEAGRIGGIGPCGRELCCATWLGNFSSVTTGSARIQDISLNPQKLAGQCAKLKCCINYEAPVYADAQKDFPAKNIELETVDGTWHFFKQDVFARLLTYSSSRQMGANLVTITVERAKEVIEMNRRGEKPDKLGDEREQKKETPKIDYQNVVGQDDLTRFDRQNQRDRRHRDRRHSRDGRRENNARSGRRDGGSHNHHSGRSSRDNRPSQPTEEPKS